jgi:type I restriction enzyme S subunit
MSFSDNIDEVVAKNRNGLLGKHANWERIRLKEIAKILNGYAFESSNFSKEQGTPLIRIRDILKGDTETYYKGTFEKEYLVRNGDLLVGMDGDFHSGLWSGDAALLNQRVCKITPDESLYLKHFLIYVLPGYLSAIHENTSSVTVKHLSSRTIADIPLPLPPLPEQKKIVAEIEKQFTRLDAGIKALKRVQANLKRYRAAVLKAACEGRLVPTEAELQRQNGTSSNYETGEQLLKRILIEREKNWQGKGKYKTPANPNTVNLPKLPESWTWASVEQLAAPELNSITDGPFGSNLKTEHYTKEGPRVIRLQNIGNGVFMDEYAHISKEHFKKLQKHQVFANDIVIAGLGENPPRSCVIPMSIGLAIVKADCIRFKPHTSVASKFINYALNSDPVRRRTKDIVHGVGRPRLNLGEIKSISLPLPSVAEQLRIITEVERHLSIITELEMLTTTNLTRATRLRQSILQKAFSVGL